MLPSAPGSMSLQSTPIVECLARAVSDRVPTPSTHRMMRFYENVAGQFIPWLLVEGAPFFAVQIWSNRNIFCETAAARKQARERGWIGYTSSAHAAPENKLDGTA